MQLGVHPFDVLQRDGLVQQLLIKGKGEPALQLMIVENGYPQHPAHEMEIREVFRVDGGVRVYLQGIVIIPAVLKQTVLRIKHLPGEEVEPFAGDAAVIQTLLASELHHQPFPHVFRSHLHDKSVEMMKIQFTF